MLENEKLSSTTPRSSRRRRWEMKSKESFETTLAVELEESPDKVQCKKNYKNQEVSSGKKERSKSSRSKSSHKTEEKDKQEIQSNKDENTDIVSTKLSALLDDAAEISQEENVYHQSLRDSATEMSKGESVYHPSLRDSEESLIKSELKHYFEPNPSGSEPSAPPVSPPKKINKTPKKKVSLKVKPIHSGTNIINSKITQQLKQLSEDVIDEEQTKNELTSVPGVAVSGLLIGPSSSSTFNGNVSTIYCEKLNNFVITNEEQIIPPQKNEPLRDIRKKETKKSHALFLQTGFRTFSVLCQGLLAGITIAHCLLIFMLEEATDVLLKKNALEHTFFALIFFLSCICLVSSFDRCDLAGQGIFSEHGIRVPWTPMLYFISVTLTLVTIRAEDFITYFNLYPLKIRLDKENLITWWKFMCLARTSFAVLAWVALVPDPHTDALINRIAELDE